MALLATLGLVLMGATALTAVAAGAVEQPPDTAGDPSNGPTGDGVGGVQPTLLTATDYPPAGNPTCTDLGYAKGYKVDVEGAPVGTYNLPTPPGGTVTITESNGVFFSWEATIGIDAVIVKGGNAADSYVYVPTEGTADTDLHPPVNGNNDTEFGISHVEFCYDVEAPPPDASPPTVEKDAAGAYVNTNSWKIEKSVLPTSVSTANLTLR